MAGIKQIDLGILPKEARRELMDFYEFILKKYGINKEGKDIEKGILADQIKIDTKKWKFNREEIHER